MENDKSHFGHARFYIGYFDGKSREQSTVDLEGIKNAGSS